MLLCGSESHLGLESSGSSMWHFVKLIPRGFLQVLQLPPLLHWFNGFANKIKLNKCDLDSVKLNILSCPFVPSGFVTQHVARDKRSMRCTWLAHDGAQVT